MEKSISIDESRAQVHIGSEGSDVEQMWYLDSRASNLMTGDKEAFAELDGDVGGSVKFGDGSTVWLHHLQVPEWRASSIDGCVLHVYI